MLNWFETQSDLAIFSAVVVIVAAGVTLWRLRHRSPGVTVWLAAAALIVGAHWHANRMSHTEQERFSRERAASAAICATELRAMGHASISYETPPDDPDYLAMIAAEKRWQGANPSIVDLYTLRPTSDGRWTSVVDAESDIDRDGRYLGARESRPSIGEEYFDDPAFGAAWSGGVGFNPRPVNTRLASAVSIATPIYDAYGAVDAILVIDFARKAWDDAEAAARAGAIQSASILGVIVFGALIVVLAMRDAMEGRRRMVESLRRTQLDLTKAREASDQAARAKTEFLGNLSREMRSTVVEMVRAIEHPGGAREDAAETIRHGQELTGLLDNVAELMRIESGRLNVDATDCSPIEIVRDVEALMRPIAEEAGVGFGVEFASRVPGAIRSDRVRLTQALESVCRHAISVSRRGDVKLVVGFSTGNAPAAMQFDVVDTGPGMAPDQAADLLRPLGQASAVNAGGQRLNLCIALHLARLLGGDLRVIESKPGAGTRMRLVVDAGVFGSKLVEATSKRSDGAGPAGERDVKGRVLVAGDGPDRERLFRFVLARAGFDVTVVDNGRAAIDAVTAGGTNGSQFGVILLDIEMPVIDGYGAARSLRRLGYAGAIIALATDPAPDEAERAASAGCDAMLVKPVARGLLIETVTEFSSCYVTANPVRT